LKRILILVLIASGVTVAYIRFTAPPPLTAAQLAKINEDAKRAMARSKCENDADCSWKREEKYLSTPKRKMVLVQVGGKTEWVEDKQ